VTLRQFGVGILLLVAGLLAFAVVRQEPGAVAASVRSASDAVAIAAVDHRTQPPAPREPAIRVILPSPFEARE
jgi:hypothetical protein